MRSMSLEKTRQREVELAQEIDRLQMEIKTLQKNSEEAANVNQQLSKEVKHITMGCIFWIKNMQNNFENIFNSTKKYELYIRFFFLSFFLLLAHFGV